MTTKPVSIVVVLIVCAFLSACAAFDLATRSPAKVYSLTPKTTFNDETPELHVKLVVEPPSATAGLNNSRIALHPDPTSLDYYAGALWVDVVPVMIETLMVESLDATDKIDALGIEALGERPDYIMRVHIREFQAEYDEGIDNPPVVNVRLQVRLLVSPRRDSLDTYSAQQLTRAKGTSVDEIVLAFDDALGKVLKRVVKWTIDTIAENRGAIDT